MKKKELLVLLEYYSLHNFSHVHVVTNIYTNILSYKNQDTTLDDASCGNMEEAEGRIILHTRNMTYPGIKVPFFQKILTFFYHQYLSFMPKRPATERALYSVYGSGRNQRNLTLHHIPEKIPKTHRPTWISRIYWL